MRTYGIQLTVRTGVNTGEVVAGDPTTGQRLVTGDTVNVAARLEQAAPPGEILIGELTYRLVRGAVEVEQVEPLELKGKAERVPAYRLLSVSDATEGLRAAAGRARWSAARTEMATLAGIFRRAVDERGCRMATVIADAGVGKSRLVREFTASLADDGDRRPRALPAVWRGHHLLAAGRGRARGGGIEQDDAPDVAREKLAVLTGDEKVTARLASAIGLSTEQFPVAETFWAARRFLEILAAERPVTVVIDDIHWAEQTFLELIGHLTERWRTHRSCCCARRGMTCWRHHPEWAVDPNAERIVLQPLTDADAGRVVERPAGRRRHRRRGAGADRASRRGQPALRGADALDDDRQGGAALRQRPLGALRRPCRHRRAAVDPGPAGRAARPAGPRGAVGDRAGLGHWPLLRGGGRDRTGSGAGQAQGAGPPHLHDAQAAGALEPRSPAPRISDSGSSTSSSRTPPTTACSSALAPRSTSGSPSGRRS